MSRTTMNETVILVAIWRLDDEAYGVNIKKLISQITRKNWNYGTMYCMLDQLVQKGLVKRTAGEPSPIRGGRKKIYYHITKEGLKALRVAYNLHAALWKGISSPVFDKKGVAP